MKKHKRSQKWFVREYRELRKSAPCIYKTKTEESYLSNGLIYDLYFENDLYKESMVSLENGTPISCYYC